MEVESDFFSVAGLKYSSYFTNDVTFSQNATITVKRLKIDIGGQINMPPPSRNNDCVDE